MSDKVVKLADARRQRVERETRRDPANMNAYGKNDGLVEWVFTTPLPNRRKPLRLRGQMTPQQAEALGRMFLSAAADARKRGDL